jgi:peptide/nickel transport system permease protein
MLAYIARRILMSVFTVWAISMLAFVIIELPEGDSIDKAMDQYMQSGGAIRMEIAQQWREYFGLDRPQYIRYLKWMGNLLRGDMGLSIWHGRCSSAFHERSIKEVIGDRIWMTVVLTGFTILVTWIFAIPVGIYSAVRQHSVGDYVFTFLGFSGLAVPDFLLGLVLMYVAFAYFDLSVGGLFSADYDGAPWSLAKGYDLLNHLWVPAIVLGTSGTAGLIRVMRNNLLDELSKPYVVTARAKGVHPLKLIIKYPVRVAINPLVSTVGYLMPSLISGSIIVSVVLSLPTLGPILLDAIITQDPYLAGFIILMTGVLTVIGTLISDILLAVVDPRIKLTRQ